MPTSLLRRRSLWRFAVLCLIARPIRVRAEDSSPTVPIQHLYDALLGVMKAGKTASFAGRYEQLAPTIDAVLDLPEILQSSVGVGWDQLPAAEQAALLDAFRRYTVDSYVSSFDSFNGQRFEVAPNTRALANGEQVVMTTIIPVSGSSHRLDYVMRQEGGTWKAVDVLADGTISRVALQRSDFRRLLTQNGGQALLVSLKRKASDLEAG